MRYVHDGDANVAIYALIAGSTAMMVSNTSSRFAVYNDFGREPDAISVHCRSEIEYAMEASCLVGM